MSKIEWTDKTWNPVVERNLEQPLHWRKSRKIFVCSMTDLFGEFVPDDLIDKVFAVMALCPQHTFQVLTKRPERALEWFRRDGWSATIRCTEIELPGKDAELLEISHEPYDYDWPLPNVWIGVTVEDQARADERIPTLLRIPAAKRFVSYEPALRPLDLQWWFTQRHDEPEDPGACGRLHYWFDEGDECPDQDVTTLDWVICGGESGPGAHPMHPDWARSVRDQCQEAGVPFFFKQWGEHEPYEEKGDGNLVPASDPRDLKKFFEGADVEHGKGGWFWPLGDDIAYRRVGKRAAGRLLDGREHMEFPS